MSEVSALSRVTDAVFAPGGPLARSMDGFEPREGQLEMARAVARVFENGGVLLAEAGTGTGKTLAYLVPAILSRQRVLVSTGTKNLQEQIFFKDIPALRAALGIPFTATCMKGRANYLCLHKLDQLNDSMSPAAHDVFLPIVRSWSTRTETGDRAELDDLPEDLPFWSEVAATAETCLGTECPRYDDCFVTRMRQRAAASDVVIVNHHLLCADAAVRQSAYGEVIPACSRAILDEAHQLEDIATQYFGVSVSTYRLEEVAHDVEQLLAGGAVDGDIEKRELAKAVERLRDRAKRFFNDLAYAHRPSRASGRPELVEGRGDGRLKAEERIRATVESLGQAGEAAGHLSSALEILQSTLAEVLVRLKPDTTSEEEEDDRGVGLQPDLDLDGVVEQIAALVRRSGEIRDELRFLMSAGATRAERGDAVPAKRVRGAGAPGVNNLFVFFVEFRGRGVFLRASPIDVSTILREVLFDRLTTTVLTSATLTVDGTFEYVRDRLGIRRASEVRLESEFDFARQAILYLPRRMPDPRSDDFSLAAGREVVEILKRTAGRAFVLFTSYATMREVLAVAELALDFPILAQGTAPRTQLLEQFRRTPHAVLFATSSFWQGVDVVGEALSCVIIDKLPFASPADPITAARIEAIRARGGDPFAEYQVPLAVLALQQGLGRLIRHRQDRGVLAVLDPRLRTKGYGRRFVTSLPPAPMVHDLGAVGDFFSQ